MFISGYLAGFIYGPIIAGGQFLAAAKRLLTRVWQMYVAHIMLFLLFTAQIARTVRKFDNPMYTDEFNVHNFLEHPDILIGQALTLRYKPVDLDVLPLYISLVAVSPLVLWCHGAPSELDPAWVGPRVHRGAGVRLEFRFLSARDTLVLQSVRLAIDVLFRGMVWRRRRRQAAGTDPVPAWRRRLRLPGLRLHC